MERGRGMLVITRVEITKRIGGHEGKKYMYLTQLVRKDPSNEV